MASNREPFDYAGKTTLVTGASSGLGAEFARQLAARGSDLVLVARSVDRLEALSEELRARDRVTVNVVAADLSRSEDIARVVDFTLANPVDVLVNNAGFGTYGRFVDLEPGRERTEVLVNVGAPVALTHAVLPGMLARRAGGIITVASTIAFQPGPWQAVYGASKAFALSFSEALWAETRGGGIRVVALCPGPTATGFFSGLEDERATSSVIYRRATSPDGVVRAGLRAFDRDGMTVVPGLRNQLLAQSYRFFPRAVLARVSGRMLAPQSPPRRVPKLGKRRAPAAAARG
jgi:short-subunit dehydrogenase